MAILYAWCVFQAYIYDAKTLTTGIVVYVFAYGVFTLLVRSPIGVLIMNLLVIISLPFIFKLPIFQESPTYFKFEPFISYIFIICIALVQGFISLLLITFGKRFLTKKYQYRASIIIAFIFTIVFTVIVTIK